MAVSYVAFTEAFSPSGFSTTLNRPGAQTAGDLVLVFADVASGDFQTTPTDFTKLRGVDSHTLSGVNRNLYIFGKMTTASEPSSYTMSRTTSSGAGYHAIRVSGTTLSQLDENKATAISGRHNPATTSHIGNSVTSLGADSLLIYHAATRFSHLSAGWTIPSGMTLIRSTSIEYSSSRQAISSGSTGTRTGTTSGNQDTFCYMVALSPPVVESGRKRIGPQPVTNFVGPGMPRFSI